MSMSPDIRFTMRVSPEVAAGGPVQLTLAVENLSDKTVDLYLRGRVIAFDVIVRDQSGATVWQRLSGEIIQAVLQLKTLSGGETLMLTARWDQRTNAGVLVPPGNYSVTGVLLTDDAPWSTDSMPLTIRASHHS